jgi:hypothetical protein
LKLRLRLEYDQIADVEAAPHPAVKQRASHFSGADQEDSAGRILKISYLRT